MGVRSCDRNGCSSVMCDRASDKYGYICDDCFEELIHKGVSVDIADFMNSHKDEHVDLDVSKFLFETEFKDINA